MTRPVPCFSGPTVGQLRGMPAETLDTRGFATSLPATISDDSSGGETAGTPGSYEKVNDMLEPDGCVQI